MLSLFQLFFLGYLSIPSIEVSCEDNDTNTSLPNINSKIIENVKNLLNPHYIGSECYEHSYFPPEKCDLKLYGFCSPYIPSCAMWKSGLFVHDPKKPAESAMTPRKCSSYWQGQFESGVWTSPDCPVTWFTPEELRYLLVRSRLHIALYGDSTVRQIFLRLVFFLRGYSVLAEHYYHTDSIYKLNGTHDNLYIGGYDSHEWYQDIDSYPFSIEFIWARRNEILFEQDFISNEPPTRRPTWHIFGGLFQPHLQKKCNCGYNFDFITQLNHTIPFPRFHNVTFFSEVSRDLTKGRNEAAPLVPGSRAETLLHWLRLQWKHQSMTYLPYFEMDQANVFHTNNNRTDVHFQCGIIEFLGSPISGLVKTPLNGDCRDMFNLNLVMILSNVLINIQEYHQE